MWLNFSSEVPSSVTRVYSSAGQIRTATKEVDAARPTGLTSSASVAPANLSSSLRFSPERASGSRPVVLSPVRSSMFAPHPYVR